MSLKKKVSCVGGQRLENAHPVPSVPTYTYISCVFFLNVTEKTCEYPAALHHFLTHINTSNVLNDAHTSHGPV